MSTEALRLMVGEPYLRQTGNHLELISRLQQNAQQRPPCITISKCLVQFQYRHRKFPFRKRSLPFETVDAISQNGRCHLKRSMPFRKLAEQTTALVNSSYAVDTLGRHFRAVLFTRWRSSNPRARELSQLNQNQPILLVQKQNKNQLRSQRGGTPLCSQLR